MRCGHGDLIVNLASGKWRIGFPRTSWLTRLSELVSFAFKWETLPQSIRKRAIKEDIQWQSLPSHLCLYTCTHTERHTHAPHVHTDWGTHKEKALPNVTSQSWSPQLTEPWAKQLEFQQQKANNRAAKENTADNALALRWWRRCSETGSFHSVLSQGMRRTLHRSISSY